jgi:hypothetical protein
MADVPRRNDAVRGTQHVTCDVGTRSRINGVTERIAAFFVKCRCYIYVKCRCYIYVKCRCYIYVKCRCYIYMDETFTFQLARASDI